ncbi:putative mucin TcMUCII [Trypanosoma cruzi]|uniref:Mucin TcMUCII, putative n=2 Tax=Trypanosoma cruzi TaxID=5693 RepID=Q4D8R3_TRYCC|nr:mucin TcMUCII, putative [Trypanosoma cruzi]EAN88915.1 mucin TcMUCII, putative [Trypanosoma cruzi]PWV10846.1 putative mucin TcMUCII [Trypanosoma cruzi]PWV10851.1 putative mucin TcMUCII [Trypanosoma cruzi]|eukprot:XP_810766.1 mucin TcMUCII [Trypanosoma cruzi strain CL Brener]
MMTCRLLCALLVLALCCCPSARATAGEVKTGEEVNVQVIVSEVLNKLGGEHNSDTDVDALRTGKAASGAGQNDNGTPSSNSELLVPIIDTLKSESPKDVQEQALDGVTETAKEGKEKPLNPEVTDTSDAQQSTSLTAVRKVSENETTAANTTTTTTTTNAPTTTTTTAPQATTTTNAEAPTTTTTRAPSHIREIDGSLSSSAWVCSPLVLAVSALAYTAVG